MSSTPPINIHKVVEALYNFVNSETDPSEIKITEELKAIAGKSEIFDSNTQCVSGIWTMCWRIIQVEPLHFVIWQVDSTLHSVSREVQEKTAKMVAAVKNVAANPTDQDARQVSYAISIFNHSVGIVSSYKSRSFCGGQDVVCLWRS